MNDSDIGLSGLGAREEGRSPFIEALLNAAPQEAMKALLERFAKNERFFARGELKKLFAKQNERLKLHIGADGISVGGKRLCAIYESACARTRDPLLCGELIAISSLQSVENPLSAITCNGINRILALAAKEADFTPSAVHFDSTSPLPITIFYGVQEGILLDIINDRLLCGAIIYESDVEQFIVSCYFADYERILNDGKLLIVSGKIQSQLAREYFCDNLIVNSFVRLELNLMNNPIINDAKNAIDIAHKETLRGWGTFEDENLAISHALQNANRPILTAANHIDLPIAVVGSAPSLESTLEFLRRHQDRLIIFSAGTALKPLLNGGVTPDFHIEIERTELIAKVMSDAPIGDIPLIAASIVSPVSLKVAKEALLFVRDSNAAIPLYENGHIVRFASPLVGNAALALSLKFSDQILLCGMDAG
ncbi:MAG: DUF115 domain-containing protein, partial [Helicobacteraceae bacterium]|nr:DUF115 domain-containing protein [Helicobacteraceae bacterium]